MLTRQRITLLLSTRVDPGLILFLTAGGGVGSASPSTRALCLVRVDSSTVLVSIRLLNVADRTPSSSSYVLVVVLTLSDVNTVPGMLA